MRKLQQKWQQRDVLLLAQVLPARGVGVATAVSLACRKSAATVQQRNPRNQGRGEKSAVQGSFRRARACWVWGVGENDLCCATG